jgi:putative membrane protein
MRPCLGAPLVLSESIPWPLILRLHRPRLLAVAASASIAMLLDALGAPIQLAPVPFQIVGVALAILMAFRNGAAYDRWWEGRKLWGGIVNASRSLARQVDAWAPNPEAARRAILRHQGWTHALAAQLRGQDGAAAAAAFLSPEESARLVDRKNAAAWLHIEQARDLATWGLSDERLARFDITLTELTAMQGGCERIRSTPLPTAYRYFTQLFVRVYVVMLPWGLVEHLGLTTALVVLLVALVFLITEHVGSLLQSPFETGPYGLPLGTIARNIEIEAKQLLGDPLPPPLAPTQVGGLDNLL